MAYNESQEMYLKTILMLRLGNESSRSVDVANKLGYSKASVSRAVGILKNEGYIDVIDGGEIVFTKEGKKKALSVLERYNVIKKALENLGMNEENADLEACKLEHVVSEELFSLLKEKI